MTEALRSWLRVVEMWSTLFTMRRYMSRERPEHERYQVKSWVVAKLTDARSAESESKAIPRDALVIAAPGEEIGDVFPTADLTDGWSDSRLLWLNGPANGLDPSVGRDASEILAAGAARFFSIDVTSERWWAGSR
jgi:hypothetical protein